MKKEILNIFLFKIIIKKNEKKNCLNGPKEII